MEENGTRLDDVLAQLRPGRAIEGAAAVLMPFDGTGRPDLVGWERQVERILAAGLVPAVNMDTGYVQLLDAETRARVLARAERVVGRAGRPFIAGAYLAEESGDLAGAYRRVLDEIQSAGGTPILFPCPALRALREPEVVELFERVTRDRKDVLLFELSEAFVPYGRIYTLETFAALLQLPGVAGLKHSSLERRGEWARLALRDRVRPGFRLYTGNDLAIDMVMYGSDYLLGLAAFFPEAFARRDRCWAEGDAAFFELNDLLQYLGALAFRAPVPAYRHSAAQFLALRGVIEHGGAPPGAPTRPDSDLAILREILARIEARLAA